MHQSGRLTEDIHKRQILLRHTMDRKCLTMKDCANISSCNPVKVISEMSLKMEDQKPFYIVDSSLDEEGCETPPGNLQGKSLSDEVTPCAPDPKDSAKDLKKDWVPSHQTLEVQVGDTGKIHAGGDSFSERIEDASIRRQAHDGWSINVHETSGGAGNGSCPVTEVVTGRGLEKVISTQCKGSAQSQEREDGAGTENTNCPRGCRICCWGFGYGLLSLALVVFSPLVMIGYCLYEGCRWLYKCKESCPK
ncbi:uncharacterized protein LOC116978279 [Amblyraja radiata]|uniref:uncharacterized protein LOC116978279 n=1 Tax=Amblyraja radiata TaxID=386614 RepID=UPI001401BD38|nr:uncharacterized protein LOC116978279 [Amblyraja radiata]